MVHRPPGEPVTELKPETGRKNTVGWWAAVVALLAVAMALAVHDYSQSRVPDERAAAVAAAEKVALDMSTIGAGNAADRLRTLSEESTGGFREHLDHNATTFEDLLRQGQVSSRAQVSGTGVEHLDGDSASVLVAVAATVVNSGRPDGQLMNLRLHVQLERVGGRWLASAMDPVA